MLRRLLAGAAVALALSLSAQAQTADELIEKNIKARGGMEKLKSVKSIRMTGKMMMGQGMEAPLVMEVKRPGMTRLEFTLQGMTGVQAYDGKEGWMLMPFMGKKDPEPMSADDLKEAEEQADMDGPLVDYKSKGHQVELLGKEKVEGSDAWKLKVTMKNGDIAYLYLDGEYFLQIKSETKRKIQGNEVEVEGSIGDYKEVEGLMLPHSMEAGLKGSPQKQKIVIEKVELNVPMEDSRFKMPEVKKAEPEAKPKN